MAVCWLPAQPDGREKVETFSLLCQAGELSVCVFGAPTSASLLSCSPSERSESRFKLRTSCLLGSLSLSLSLKLERIELDTHDAGECRGW